MAYEHHFYSKMWVSLSIYFLSFRFSKIFSLRCYCFQTQLSREKWTFFLLIYLLLYFEKKNVVFMLSTYLLASLIQLLALLAFLNQHEADGRKFWKSEYVLRAPITAIKFRDSSKMNSLETANITCALKSPAEWGN